MPSDTTQATGDATMSSFEGVRTADVNGAVLAYREQGEGAPVVFVHGSVDDLRSWDQQLPAIGASYRAIAYSRRYARPNEDIEPDADDQTLPHVDDLNAFLRVMDAAPAHLVGHSWGGLICLLAAIRHPQLVRSLVLQEPPVLSLFMSVPPRPTELLRLFVRRPSTALVILSFAAKTAVPAQRAFRRGDDEAAMQKFAYGLLGKDTFEQLPQERKQQAFENVRGLRAQVLGAGFPPLSEDDVRGVKIPTLLMTGERSPAYLPRLTDRLQQLLPNAERVEIAAASHIMSEENPGVVNEAILGFLARSASLLSGRRRVAGRPKEASVERSPILNTRPAVPGEPIATHDVRGGGGLRLHVLEWGNRDGPPILLIHGWSQSQLCWARQVSGKLIEGFRIVTFDNRGHGMSEKPTDAGHYVDARLWADDLAAVIDQTGLDRPVLVGWSYGGFIATDYVRVYGEQRIGGINLVGGAVVLRSSTVDHVGAGFLENAEGACVPDLATNIAAIQRFLAACTAQPLSRDDWSTALCWNMVVPAEVRAALIAREIDADDVLSKLSVPVLVTHGRSDAIVLPSMAEHVLDVCETAEPSWYEGIGHMPFWEDPVRFDHELGEFAGSVR